MADVEAAVAPDASVQAERLDQLTAALRPLIHEFIASADRNQDAPTGAAGGHVHQRGEARPPFAIPGPESLQKLLSLELPYQGQGNEGVIDLASRILSNSVNTWHQGFLDKLYGSTDPVGVVSELLIAVLNTNVHVYKVAPALTVVEKAVTRTLAGHFGFTGFNAGGISQSGGSGANLTALVIARNCKYPDVKTEGLQARRLVLFTSAHGHYSFKKAAQICGLGSQAVKSVPVDANGRMSVADLQQMLQEARKAGEMPFFVNATAGTTVLGSFDPLAEIADVCQRENLWFHVDASWGGSVVFSPKHRHKLMGAERANTLAVNPHKMLGTPITCSFLLTDNLKQFHEANTLPAAYLFHGGASTGSAFEDEAPSTSQLWDLADLTLQCGRRGDALKLAMAWTWYGGEGFAARIDHAFLVAEHLTRLVESNADLILVSDNPPPCLQVCFYFARGGRLGSKTVNSTRTKRTAEDLVGRGFLVDYAPGQGGLFFRAVVSLNTKHQTVEKLVETVTELGRGHVDG